MTKGPEDLKVHANGLEHRVLEWAGPDPTRTVVLVHGYMDAARAWDRVAPALAAGGVRVLAPDMRGFGDGARAPRGSYYHFADYVADLADLVDALSPGAPVGLVGHSMGGTVTTLYAGAFPERVEKLAVLEGLGPPDNGFEVGPTRMRRWIEGVRSTRARDVPTLSREEALARLAANHAGVDEAVLADRLEHLVREVGEGRVAWRVDPLHRTVSPVPFFARLFLEFARRVSCPVLFVSGGPGGYHPPDEEERLAAFGTLERDELADAGHMMHWTRPDALSARLLRFLDA